MKKDADGCNGERYFYLRIEVIKTDASRLEKIDSGAVISISHFVCWRRQRLAPSGRVDASEMKYVKACVQL